MQTSTLPRKPGLLDLAGVSGYTPRQPRETAVWKTVQEYWPEYCAETARSHGGRTVPEFVDKAVQKFLVCGHHSSGFVRVRCTDCGDDLLVPFSCKQRGICSSCDGKRMMELSIGLVDEVIPHVATRQWVLTFPYWLRFVLAYDATLMSGVLGVWVKTVRNWYRKQARDEWDIADGACASVSVVQRFGDALTLNPHIHSIFCEGVWFDPDGNDTPIFLPLRGPSDTEVQEIVLDARRRTLRWLVRKGVVHPQEEHCVAEDDLARDDPVRAWCTKAAILDRVAIGKHAKQLVARLGNEPVVAKKKGRRCAMAEGFSLHANTRIGPMARDHLERLCRYILRPALCNARLERLSDGRILAKLKRQWSDGTWAKIFEPLDFLAKISALIPRPGRHQLRYHGQFAAQGRWRSKIVLASRKPKSTSSETPTEEQKRTKLSWAVLLKRAFAADVLQCACGGRREVIAVIEHHKTVVHILDHVGIDSTPPAFKPARPPPEELWPEHTWA